MSYVKLLELKQAALVTITRERVLNALNPEVLKELDAAFDRIDVEKQRCVILTGAGTKAFVAGADLGVMKDFSPAQAKEFACFGSAVFRKIEMFPLPVIAAVNGYALGGGLELALACDIRIAAEHAVLGFPELQFGIIPGFGGTQRLMRAIPAGKAKELIYTGVRVNAVQALQMGLVNAVYPGAELMEQALIMAGRIDGAAGTALAAAKQVMNEGINERMDVGLALESNLFARCFLDPEQAARMKAFTENGK